MEHNLWTYPWDIKDFGMESVITQASNWGLSGISLAMSYHTGKLLLATNPKRKVYFPEDGAVYFQPDFALYDGTFSPRAASFISDSSVLDDSVAFCHKIQLRLTAWLVCLHNTYIGYQQPSLCTRNAFGDPYYYSLCPAKSHVRSYICSLIKDLTINHQVDAVDLESLNYLGFHHGYHHELNGFAINPTTAFLLSLCFCDDCLWRAAAYGVDTNGVRDLVKHLIETGLQGKLPGRWAALDLSDPFAWMQTELGPYLEMRKDVVGSLLAEVKASARKGVELRFIMRPIGQAWQMGVDITKVAASVETVVLCCYDQNAERIGDWLASTSASIGGACRLIAAIRLIEPDTDGFESLAAKYKICVKTGVDGISYYNYALMPAQARYWLDELKSRGYLR